MNFSKEKVIRNKGITLIALVITIIVLLILAGVSIAMLTGDNGILTQAQRAKNETEQAQVNEESILENYEQYIEGSTNGSTLTTVTGNETTNTEVQDSLGNEITIPAGFKVVNPGDNVEDGIVIEDISHEATAGSQFVWIPVGEINTTKGKVSISLDRYTFDKTGIETSQENKAIYDDSMHVNFEELSSTTFDNIVSKNIEEFKMSTNSNGGYYIGRYEARTGTERKDKTDMLTQITEKSSDFVYNYVTQSEAASLSQNMYNDTNFTSDLLNSYSWDTAILFIQKCSTNLDYSREFTINNVFANKGTNNLEKEDKKCNIFDMASNCLEWTTETCNFSDASCTSRGDFFKKDESEGIIKELFCSSFRNSSSPKTSTISYSFRPILYLK